MKLLVFIDCNEIMSKPENNILSACQINNGFYTFLDNAHDLWKYGAYR